MDDADDRAPSLLDPPPAIENPTDAELVESARGGDSFAVTRLWQRHLAVAWTAARAASGRPDAEPVVVRTAERLIAELAEGRGPAGAVRPHLLALTRQAVADSEVDAGLAAESAAEGDDPDRAVPALRLAPVATYRDVLPDGVGEETATAFASLPTRWQEALWLAEIDGLTTTEVGAELGLAAHAVESMLADARSALRTEWMSQRLAGLPEDSPCRAAASLHGRRSRAHLDACAGCRAAAAPPEAVSARALATLPLLLLGAGAGTAFLESVRPGLSIAATEPVPPLAETAAAIVAAAPEPAPGAPAGPAVPLAAALVAAMRLAPRRRVAAAGGALVAIAASTALVASLVAWNGGPDDGSMFLADAGSGVDVTTPAPRMMPPVVVATEVPDDREEPRSPTTTPDAAPEPEPSSAPGAEADAPDGGDAAAPDASAPDAATGARPGTGGSTTGDGSQSIVAPRPPASDDRAPLVAELGRPGSNGWRTLTVTGQPNSAFSATSGGGVVYSGFLDSTGTAVLQVRGTGDVGSLTLSYGTSGDTDYAIASEGAPLQETARRGRTSSPTPAP